MSTTFKVATTDCDDIEITGNFNIKSSAFISGYLTNMGLPENYIDLTTIGHHNLTATQARRFYDIWNFVCATTEGSEYLLTSDIDYWKYRNYRLDDCLAKPISEALKIASDHEAEIVKQDTVNGTKVPYEELTSKEHIMQFLQKGYISIGLIADLIRYANFLSIDPVIRILTGAFAGHLKIFSKEFRIEKVDMPVSVQAPVPDTGLSAMDVTAEN
jgi:hypothetical protein